MGWPKKNPDRQLSRWFRPLTGVCQRSEISPRQNFLACGLSHRSASLMTLSTDWAKLDRYFLVWLFFNLFRKRTRPNWVGGALLGHAFCTNPNAEARVGYRFFHFLASVSLSRLAICDIIRRLHARYARDRSQWYR